MAMLTMSFKWSSKTTSDLVDEVEAALQFDGYEITFRDAKSQLALSRIKLMKNEKIE